MRQDQVKRAWNVIYAAQTGGCLYGLKHWASSRMKKKRPCPLPKDRPSETSVEGMRLADRLALAFAGRLDCLEQGGGLVAFVEALG